MLITFFSGSCKVPAGCTVVLSLFGLNYNPKTFPDPERFDPERFSPINAGQIDKSAFMPYSGGPRNCIGRKFRTKQLKYSRLSIILECSSE